jgi:hypothetical protein
MLGVLMSRGCLGVLKVGVAHLSFARCNVELLEVCVPQLRLKMPHLAVYLKDALLPTVPQPPKDGGPAPARASALRLDSLSLRSVAALLHRSASTAPARFVLCRSGCFL